MRLHSKRSGRPPIGTDDEPLAGAQGKDFSGRDFCELTVRSQNFFESIFNGCRFASVLASESIFQHAEFTETSIVDSTFEDSSFDHSDFVLSSIRDSRFLRCTFQNAEWRDVVFGNVTFKQCIFRNTTSSLAQFVRCAFDEASAASFVGSSKRFSLFSETAFRLPPEHVSFLRSNFGLRDSSDYAPKALPSDPVFQLSLAQYVGRLDVSLFHKLFLEAVSAIAPQQRLQMRYLAEMCRVRIAEGQVSVFGMRLLEANLSQLANAVRDRSQALELLQLILALRVSLRDQVSAIDNEATAMARTGLVQRLRVSLAFENSYDRKAIEDYLDQLRRFCRLTARSVKIATIEQGSTIGDVAIVASTYLTDVVKFIKYSLSLATITLTQTRRLKSEYKKLRRSSRAAATSPLAKERRSRTVALANSQSLVKEVVGAETTVAKPIEVFVDAVGDRVLVVGGKVKVTITLA